MPDPGWRKADRVAGTIGGAVGILPIVAMARAAATKLLTVPSFAGAERLSRDVKAATWIETGALLICVPAAALFFGRLLPQAALSRGISARRASLAGAGFGTSFVLFRAGVSPTGSLAAGFLVAVSILAAPRLRGSRGAAASFVTAIFLAGLFAWYRPLAAVELFEDGLILFGAGEMARGARPYLDVYPIHGWGADGGVLALLFPLVNHDLVAFRLLRATLVALAFASLAAGSLLFFRDPGWAAVGFAACLAFCPYPSERHVPALVAWCLLIRASRAGRPRDWTLAGVATAVTLFMTLDFGAMLLVAGAVTPMSLHLLCGKSPAR